MSRRLTGRGVFLALASLIGLLGWNAANQCQAEDSRVKQLQWRELDEIADLARTQPRPVLWFRVLGDMKGYM